jgi:phosphate:Na+ symporter
MTEEKPANFENLQHIFNTIEENYSSALNTFYSEAQDAPLEKLILPRLLTLTENFYSNKAMLMTVKFFLLKEEETQEFHEVPLHKR